jgi:serine protease Do
MAGLLDRPLRDAQGKLSSAAWSDPAERLRASVAQIINEAGPHGPAGAGAAIAWSASGLFVTSAHVIRSPRITVVTLEGRRVPGELVWQERRRDVALVRAPAAGMPPVRTADPSAMRPGSLVMAIGHPFGLVDAVSTGVLQSVGELPLEFDFEGKTLRWVQADVRLGPGNSGGPLADADGRVIGVAAMIVAGIALAVPAPEVEALVASSG